MKIYKQQQIERERKENILNFKLSKSKSQTNDVNNTKYKRFQFVSTKKKI